MNTAPLISTVLYLHPSFGVLLFAAECETSANEQITRVTVEMDSEIKIIRVGAHASRGPLIILGPLSQRQSHTRSVAGPLLFPTFIYEATHATDRKTGDRKNK